MTGKAINSSAPSLLILILPFAFVVVLLFKVWPLLLALLFFGAGLRVWQQYQWKQWCKQVNPFFNQLVKDNQGCVTPLDLSMKANLASSAAQRFLDKKAEEFGAQRRVYDDKGTVYYFLTASALGSIFEESEPPPEIEDEAEAELPTSPAPPFEDPLAQKEPSLSETESLTRDVPEFPEPIAEKDTAVPVERETPKPEPPEPEAEHHRGEDKTEAPEVELPNGESSLAQSLIQAELAKRLDVHSSTVGKRKSDPDFAEWSQSRDPEGIAWEYSPDTREFIPIEGEKP